MRRPGSQDLTFTSNSAEETANIAAALGLVAGPGDFLALFGDLGVGKTVFAKGFCAALGIDPMEVDSPTFVLLNEYKGRLPVYHFDAYRLEGGREELTELGYFDETLEEGVILMEWAERVGIHLPAKALHLRIEMLDAKRRRLTIEEPSERVAQSLSEFLS